MRSWEVWPRPAWFGPWKPASGGRTCRHRSGHCHIGRVSATRRRPTANRIKQSLSKRLSLGIRRGELARRFFFSDHGESRSDTTRGRDAVACTRVRWGGVGERSDPDPWGTGAYLFAYIQVKTPMAMKWLALIFSLKKKSTFAANAETRSNRIVLSLWNSRRFTCAELPNGGKTSRNDLRMKIVGKKILNTQLNSLGTHLDNCAECDGSVHHRAKNCALSVARACFLMTAACYFLSCWNVLNKMQHTRRSLLLFFRIFCFQTPFQYYIYIQNARGSVAGCYYARNRRQRMLSNTDASRAPVGYC